MPPTRVPFRAFAAFLCAAAIFQAAALAQNPAPQSPLLPENSVTRVSEHVYAILGFPNIGIVVGSRATLVVDTGMGRRNGALVAREAAKLGKHPLLYLTTTHFHPEHAAGEPGFPLETILIRPAVQQEEMEQRGSEFIEMFRGRSALNRELLQDVKLRRPDVIFDREVKLDLGGATARLFWLGAAHTRGDELIFVEEDRTLLSGDIVQKNLVPGMPNADSSPKSWLAILDQIEPLQPRFIVPDHGQLGDGSLIAKQRTFMLDLQSRALELKRQGKSIEEAAAAVTNELKAKYPEYTNINSVANVVRRVYAEAP
ncbi:MAG TPA: MBL fold metallo-hydrolase [Bryobacterales bacterium]|jgi:glyoxylase-like metal-dependent hydrolase (beta-lactamase superfamily II)|nr:MBL fold metallo-hydrolase [Bryobacterales bacterium]